MAVGIVLGGGLSLELLEQHHAQELYELIVANQERLARWETWAHGDVGVSAQVGYIAHCLRGFAEGRALQFVIRQHGELVGRCGLTLTPWLLTGDLGYWVDKGIEGSGVAKAACQAVITEGFARGLARLEVHTDTTNLRSRALAERLGFTLDGVLRNGGSTGAARHDVAVYGLLPG